jgi:hypothetical protein
MSQHNQGAKVMSELTSPSSKLRLSFGLVLLVLVVVASGSESGTSKDPPLYSDAGDCTRFTQEL